VESAGQPHAVAVGAYVGYLARQRRIGASEAGASTRRVTVHVSLLGYGKVLMLRRIPKARAKYSLGYRDVNHNCRKMLKKIHG
jgi:hypothetical protein